MSISEANISNIGSLERFLTEIKTAGVPERVTVEFLKTLQFKSSNDRPIIPIMKGIGFLDQSGAPTVRISVIVNASIGDHERPDRPS